VGARVRGGAASAPTRQLGELTTFVAIQQAVQQVTQELNNFAVILGGEARQVVGQASEQLNFRLQQLRDLVGDQVTDPLIQLGLNVQELARQLTSSLQSLSAIINGQRECLNQNAEILLSTVANITQDLKRGVPLVGTTTQVSYFQFEGLPARSVPISGGRMTMFGSNLWPRPALPPTVALLSADRRTVIESLQAQRSTNNNNVSVTVSGAAIQAHTGECLQLKLIARDTTGIWPFRRTVETELYLPMCVSQTYRTEFVVEAGLTYEVKDSGLTQALSEQEFRQDNSSCEHKQPVSINKVWGDLPSGPEISSSRIVSISERNGPFQRHTSWVTSSIQSSNTVKMEGTIDTADCIGLPFGRSRLNSSTILQRYITPTAMYDRTRTLSSSASIVRAPMSFPSTQVRVLIPKERQSPSTIFWYKVTRLVNGVETGHFDSARTTIGSSGGTSPAGSIGNLQIQGTLNPAPVNGNAELLVTITAPPCSQ
jgi:hypothetical protein